MTNQVPQGKSDTPPNMLLGTGWIRPERKWWPEKHSADSSQIDGYSYCNIHDEQSLCNGFSRCGQPPARLPLSEWKLHSPNMFPRPLAWDWVVTLSQTLSSRRPRWYWLTHSKDVIMNTWKPHEGEGNGLLEMKCLAQPSPLRALRHCWEEPR